MVQRRESHCSSLCENSGPTLRAESWELLLLELLLSQDDELPIVLMSLGIAADVTVVGHLSGEPGTVKASHTRCEGK